MQKLANLYRSEGLPDKAKELYLKVAQSRDRLTGTDLDDAA